MFQVIKKLIIKPQPHVYVIRHGHTDLNASSSDSKDRIRGWTDVPLNDEGREDADHARKMLLKNEVKPNKIYASNLQRTLETAAIVNKSFNVPITPTINLRPWNLGELQGQETDKVMPIMDMYAKQAPDHPVPDGESFNSFKKRYITFLEQVIQEAKKDGLTILLVTHFRNVKMAQAWIAKGMKKSLDVDEDILKTNNVQPGDIFELPLDFEQVVEQQGEDKNE